MDDENDANDVDDTLDGDDNDGSQDDDGADGSQDDQQDDNDDGSQDDTDDADDSVKLKAENRKLKREAQRLRRERNAARKAAPKPDAKDGDDDDADIAAARAERDEAKREAADLRLQTTVERLAVSQRFHDPEDALALLNRDDIDVDEDTGKVDPESVKDALKELAERKPHLVKKGGKGSGSNMAGGRRQGQPEAETVADRKARLGLGRKREPLRFNRGGVVMPGSDDSRSLVSRAAEKSKRRASESDE